MSQELEAKKLGILFCPLTPGLLGKILRTTEFPGSYPIVELSESSRRLDSMNLKHACQRLRILGVDDETPPLEAQYIILVNSVLGVAFFLGLIYLLLNLSRVGISLLAIVPNLVTLVSCAVALWLNQRKRYWLATTSFLALACISPLSWVGLYGTDSLSYFFTLPLIGAIPLVYPVRHRGTAVILTALAVAVFLFLALLGSRIVPLLSLDSGIHQSFRGVTLVLLPLVIAFVSFYSHAGTVAAEQKLAQRSQELAEALENLKQTQGQLIESENQARLSRVTAGLLHEVNTPLGALRSSLDLIVRTLNREASSESKADPDSSKPLPAAEAFGLLRTSSDRISNIIESLRQFVGLDEAERKPYDIRRSMDIALRLLEHSLGDRIEVKRSYPATLQPVLCYPARLNRVFLNLLQNSIQAIEGTGIIRVSASESTDFIEVEITDTGRGISSDRLAEVFRFELAAKGQRVGMRMGLPVSKRSIEELGGSLSLESSEGKGTTVRVKLPVMA